jgi:hypothetical protein
MPECIGADLYFVTWSETRISNFTGKHINDALTISSKLKVLSIEPYHDHALSVGKGLEYGKKTIGMSKYIHLYKHKRVDIIMHTRYYILILHFLIPLGYYYVLCLQMRK